jgi:hypothetical protein
MEARTVGNRPLSGHEGEQVGPRLNVTDDASEGSVSAMVDSIREAFVPVADRLRGGR